MLGLGSTLTKLGKIGLPIVTDNIVLQHKYIGGEVHQVSTGAASFNGTDDYISIPTPSAFSGETLNSFNVTMSAWANFKTIGQYEAIVCLGTFDLEIAPTSASAVGIWVDNAAYGGATYTPALNVWNHYAATKSGNTYTFYVNGVEIGSSTDADNATVGTDSFIGRNGSTAYFDGYICNVGIWSTALSQAEIKSIMWKNYADLTSAETTSLVSWWNLDSPSGGFYSGNGTENLAPTTVYDNHNTTLGSELVTNGDFSNGLTGWTTDGTVSVNTSGVSIFGSTDSDVYIYQDLGSTGNTYKVTFDLVVNDGVIKIGTNTDFQYSYSAGTYTNESIYIVPTASNRFIFRRQSGTLSATLDNISIKQVNGNIGTLS